MDWAKGRYNPMWASKSTKSEHLDEKECLKRTHRLERNDKRVVDKQFDLIKNFKKQLYLCYEDRQIEEIKYQHWFVTDKSWSIEFGEDDSEDVV